MRTWTDKRTWEDSGYVNVNQEAGMGDRDAGEWLESHKLRVIENVYGNAKVACEKWMKGQLYAGKPINLGKNKIHVYGLYMRNWSKVYVEFTDRYIMVVKPP